MINKIEPREARVLRMHFGLDGGSPVSLREIGSHMGLTRERIRQILRKGLSKMYDYMN